MRLDKFLANKNIVSRSKTKVFLKNNIVDVNGFRILKPNYVLNEDDNVSINNKNYTFNKYLYFVMNKPKGYICSNIDEHYPSVLNLLKDVDFQNDLFTVGRLDVDTTGVLLITNDGKFSHQLLSPKNDKQKTYKVTLKNNIKTDDINKLENGIMLDGKMTKNAKVIQKSDNIILLTISEGKYHQVKRMIKNINNEVVSLHRVSFDKYTIDFDDVYIKIDPY